MLTIRWLGQACVIIKRPAAGDQRPATLVMDPYGEGGGFRLPKIEAELVTVSHDHFDHNNVDAVGGKPFLVNEPGEYEVSGFAIEAIPSYHDNAKGAKRGGNLIMRVQTNEFSFAHFGDFGQEELSPEQTEALGSPDIVFLPVGGFYTIDGKHAAKIINQLEPKLAIPIHYRIPGLTLEELVGPEAFFEATGFEPIIIEGDWKVKISDLPSEGTKIVQLTAQSKMSV